MITIGVTGGYATGKTVVAGILRGLGARVVDADRIALKVMRPQGPAWQKVVRHFGKGILRKDGLINRKKLAGIIFSSSARRRRLNQAVHPVVIGEIKRIIKGGQDEVLVVDVPLLFEAGMEGLFDKIIVVNCSKEIQKQRAKRRDKLPSARILQRINSQWPLARKIKQADFVVDNSGSIGKTKKQVKKIWGKMKIATKPLRHKENKIN